MKEVVDLLVVEDHMVMAVGKDHKAHNQTLLIMVLLATNPTNQVHDHLLQTVDNARSVSIPNTRP